MPLVLKVRASSCHCSPRAAGHSLTRPAVADALVRYINQGITVGSVNMPEAQLRSLTLDEPDHARVRICLTRKSSSYDSVFLTILAGHLHSPQRSWRFCAKVLFLSLMYCLRQTTRANEQIVNEILGDHNVDKQISDSRGDVGRPQQLAIGGTY